MVAAAAEAPQAAAAAAAEAAAAAAGMKAGAVAEANLRDIGLMRANFVTRRATSRRLSRCIGATTSAAIAVATARHAATAAPAAAPAAVRAAAETDLVGIWKVRVLTMCEGFVRWETCVRQTEECVPEANPPGGESQEGVGGASV